jgi:hydroxymethylpyrimidine pyrophosphatase-like HAD family hydrolase
MGTLSVIASDYDGTLTHTGRLDPELERLLGQARAAGFRLVLVTGRQLQDLLKVCPRALAILDRLVLENGALLVREGGQTMELAPPIDARLAPALEAQGVWVVQGQVLLATLAQYEPQVRAEVERLGLDVRLFRNRASLMIAPAGVSKASGLSHALASLGASFEQTIGIGDAENDRELLEACAVGVAVGDALEELKAIADRVLDEPNGAGVAGLLRELIG